MANIFVLIYTHGVRGYPLARGGEESATIGAMTDRQRARRAVAAATRVRRLKDRLREAEDERNAAIVQLLDEGMTPTDLHRVLGLSVSSIKLIRAKVSGSSAAPE